MKASRLLVFVVVAAVLGYTAGVIGSEVQHRNESTFGASYARFQHEWVCLPAFPGFLLAEIRAGYDWGVDEAWSFRHEVRVWNAVLWAAAVSFVAFPFAFRDFIRWVRARRGVAAPEL